MNLFKFFDGANKFLTFHKDWSFIDINNSKSNIIDINRPLINITNLFLWLRAGYTLRNFEIIEGYRKIDYFKLNNTIFRTLYRLKALNLIKIEDIFSGSIY